MKPILQRLKLGRTEDFEVLFEKGADTSSLDCLAVLAARYGIHEDAESARSRLEGFHAISYADLVRAGEQLGLELRAINPSAQKLHKVACPCLLQLRDGRYVIAKRLTRTAATLHDPASGAQHLPLSELVQELQGPVVEVSSALEFKARKQRPKLEWGLILGKIVGFKRALFQVFVLALGIEIITLLSPLFVQFLIDYALTAGYRDLIIVLTVCFLVLLALRAITHAVRRWTVLALATGFNVQWARNVFRHLLQLPIAYFEKKHLGDIVSRFGAIHQIQQTLTVGLIETLVDGFWVTITLCVMFIYSSSLAFITLVPMILYFLIRMSIFSVQRTVAAQQIQQTARQDSIFMETIRGIQSIRILNRSEERLALWLDQLIAEANAGLQSQRWLTFLDTAKIVLFGSGRIIMIAVGGLAVLDSQLTIGMLLAMVLFQELFLTRAGGFIDSIFTIRLLELQGSRLSNIVLAEPEQNTSGMLGVAIEDKAVLIANNLRVVYTPNGRPVLDGLKLRVPPGRFIVLQGASGSGKTTLYKALLGLIVPSGRLTFGKHSFRQIGWYHYRQAVTGVLQGDRLFAGTLAQNISSFARTPDYKWMTECARIARVHDEVERLPLRYQTLIGDMGSALSAGQIQRLLVARALYLRPRLLLLDEALSQLDAQEEVAILTAIKNSGIACVATSHRGTLSELADERWMLQDGKISIMQAAAGDNAKVISLT